MDGINDMCRTCLRRGRGRMILLDQQLCQNRTEGPLIFQALEEVVAVKIKLEKNYPSAICSTCLRLLKISYDFKVQFDVSEKTLNTHIIKPCLENLIVQYVEDSDEDVVDSEIAQECQNQFEDNIFGTDNLKPTVDELEANVADNFVFEVAHSNNDSRESFVVDRDEGPTNLEDKDIVLLISTENIDFINDFSIFEYECTNCANVFKSLESLKRHQEIDHPDPKIIDKIKLEELSDLDKELFKGALLLKHECDNCPKVYSSIDKFKKHKRVCVNKHKNKMIKKGPISLVVEDMPEFESPNKINLEDMSEIDREIFKSALNLNKCKNCNNYYSTENRLERHTKVCGKPKKNQKNPRNNTCKICGHIATNNSRLSYHIKSQHQEKKYFCEVCGKNFSIKSVFTMHLQTHSKETTMVVCPICGKGFHYTSGLHYHMKMHLNERNYACEYCNRKFLTPSALKRHLATHTGERKYQCTYCEKKFKGLADLKLHKLRHTGDRPHSCDYCDKKFISKYHLQAHVSTHVGSLSCDYCQKSYLDAYVLQLHKKFKHKHGEKTITTNT